MEQCPRFFRDRGCDWNSTFHQLKYSSLFMLLLYASAEGTYYFKFGNHCQLGCEDNTTQTPLNGKKKSVHLSESIIVSIVLSTSRLDSSIHRSAYLEFLPIRVCLSFAIPRRMEFISRSTQQLPVELITCERSQ